MSGEARNDFSEGADASLPVDFETRARLEALLEAAGIGKLSTSDGKAFADPDVLHRLTSTVSYALDEAAAALYRLRAEAAGRSTQRSLPEACSEGDVATVRRLLDEGQSVHETSEDGESLLSLACSAGYFELTEVLLSMRANVEERGPKGGCTPLMEAASGGYKDVIELLIEHGACVNAVSNTGNTALTFACCGGFVDIVKILISAGADLEIQNENGHTPLMEASSGGHVDVAAILLKSGAGINTHSNEFKESALTLACYKGHLEMVRFLLQAGADQEHKTDEMHTALMEASMDGHVDVARLLLDSGAQVNMPADSFESPLTLAACGGHVPLASLLLSRGANLEEVNDEGYTPLMEASREGHEEMVSLLISHGANVNTLTEETRETALTLSACGGFFECSKLLLQAGAKLEAGCSTALMEAAQEGHLDLVNFLLKQGAKVDSQTSSGNTALSYACEHGRTDVADALLCTGAYLEHESEGGRTPLMKASRAGHACTVQYLISRGARVNKITRNNEHTALSLACLYGHVSVVELLLLHGADSTVVLKDGSTMLLEAAKGGHTSIVYILLDLPNWFSHSSIRSQCNFEGTLQLPEKSVSRVPTQALPLVVPPREPDTMCHQEAHLSALDDSGDAEDLCNMLTVRRCLQQASSNSCRDCHSEVPENSSPSDDAAEPDLLNAQLFCDTGTKLELTELEQRIKKVIETNAQLKFQTPTGYPIGCNSHESEDLRILKKQRILEELQKVEHGLHAKASDQLKNCLDMQICSSIGEKVQRDIPDGSDGSINDCEGNLVPSDSDSVDQAMNAPDAFNVKAEEVAQSVSPVEIGCYDKEVEQPCPMPDEILNNVTCANINCCTESNNDTPLTLACAGGHTSLVKLLIQRGANLEHRDKKGFTPLILAATAGHVGSVNALLDADVYIESQSERTKDTALSLACSGGRLEVVEVLLERGSNIEHRNVSDYTPLSLAASGGYVKIIEMLLNSGAEINSRTGSKLGISPLMLAAMNGHKEAVLLLLDMGADINAQIETNRNTALTLACFQGRHEVVSLLVDRRANVEHRAKTGLTPLMEAASGGYAEVGRVLLEKGADPNAAPVPSSRDTALTIAADKGHLRFCELVLSGWAMVDIRNKKGSTPFWLACNGGYLDVAKLLAQHGATLDMADNRSITPLMAAFRKGHIKVVRWLSKVVSQFPSDSECMRFVSGITDRELLKRCHMCMECITKAKERQAQEANKYASELLEELDKEKTQEENRKERAARKREKRRKKRQEKQQLTKQVQSDENCSAKDVGMQVEYKEICEAQGPARVEQKHSTPAMQNNINMQERLKEVPSTATVPKPSSVVHPTPAKKNPKKDEEWKEVVRKSKKIIVPSNLVARIIGRGGCNINAIREETGAHIDINKHRKGPERTITIRGPTEAIRHAHGLITELMKDKNADVDIQNIIKTFQTDVNVTLNYSSASKDKAENYSRVSSASVSPSSTRSAPSTSSTLRRPTRPETPMTKSNDHPVASTASVSESLPSIHVQNIPAKAVKPSGRFSVSSADSMPAGTNNSSLLPNQAKDAPLSFLAKNGGKLGNRPVQPVAPMISHLSLTKTVQVPIPSSLPAYRSAQSVAPAQPHWQQYMSWPVQQDQQKLISRVGNISISEHGHIPSQSTSYNQEGAMSSIHMSDATMNSPGWDCKVQFPAIDNADFRVDNAQNSVGMEQRKIWPIGTERAIGQRRVAMIPEEPFSRSSCNNDLHMQWMEAATLSTALWDQNKDPNSCLGETLPSLPTEHCPTDVYFNGNSPGTNSTSSSMRETSMTVRNKPGFANSIPSNMRMQPPIGSHLMNASGGGGTRDFAGRSRIINTFRPGVMKNFAPAESTPPMWSTKQGRGSAMMSENISHFSYAPQPPYAVGRSIVAQQMRNAMSNSSPMSPLNEKGNSRGSYSPMELERLMTAPEMPPFNTGGDVSLNSGASGSIGNIEQESSLWKW